MSNRPLWTALLSLSVASAGSGGSPSPSAPPTQRPAIASSAVAFALENQIGQAQQEAFEFVREGQYLPALTRLENVFAATERSPELQAQVAQSLAAFSSFAGLHEKALKLFSPFDPPSAPPSPALLAKVRSARLEDAVQPIVRAAKGRQVVILNEMHHVAQNREFARRLALALRKEGFEYFAAETFSPDIAETARLGYPVWNTGYYTVEPVFGELVRSVARAGYKLVAYEATDFGASLSPAEQINERERQQAENLMTEIFRKNPKARVMIYVGYSHNLETPQPGPDGTLKWMALRLKELTGIDPLTIDQTQGSARAEAKQDTAVRRAVMQVKAPASSSVLTDTRGRPLRMDSGQLNDIQVFHPDPRLIAGRLSWLYGAGRQPVTVKVPPGAGGRRLVQAFYRTENSSAVPADQVLVDGTGPVTLLLLQGEYRLSLQDEKGQSTALGALTVK